MSKKEKLLGLAKRKYLDVDVDGESFRIQSLSARELGEYIEFIESGKDDIKSVIHLLVKSLVEEDGSRMFEDTETDSLVDLPMGVMLVLVDACQKLSGLDKDVKRDHAKN